MYPGGMNFGPESGKNASEPAGFGLVVLVGALGRVGLWFLGVVLGLEPVGGRASVLAVVAAAVALRMAVITVIMVIVGIGVGRVSFKVMAMHALINLTGLVGG